MALGPTTLLVYGILMILGGLLGARAGSRVSLTAGAGSGLLLLGAWLLTRFSVSAGLWMGALLALLLSATFGVRAKRTGKFMPAGMLLAVSVAALVLLLVSIRGA